MSTYPLVMDEWHKIEIVNQPSQGFSFSTFSNFSPPHSSQLLLLIDVHAWPAHELNEEIFTAATLLVDEDDAMEQDNYYFNTGEGTPNIVSVAGTKEKTKLERTTFEQPFVGTIFCSSLINLLNVLFYQ